MRYFIKISSILIYILFAQVYPVVHWHAHEHHNDIELHLSVHPPEIPVDNHHHDDHEKHSAEHGHDEAHFDVDWDYILLGKIFKFVPSIQYFIINNPVNFEQRIVSRQPLEVPLKIPRHYLPSTIPERAPPRLS